MLRQGGAAERSGVEAQHTRVQESSTLTTEEVRVVLFNLGTPIS